MPPGFEEIALAPVQISTCLKYRVKLEYDREGGGFAVSMPDIPEACSYIWPDDDASRRLNSLVETVFSGYQDFNRRFPVPSEKNTEGLLMGLSKQLSENILEYNKSFDE
jgi:predicted RNase H-like HicB family nuclease